MDVFNIIGRQLGGMRTKCEPGRPAIGRPHDEMRGQFRVAVGAIPGLAQQPSLFHRRHDCRFPNHDLARAQLRRSLRQRVKDAVPDATRASPIARVRSATATTLVKRICSYSVNSSSCWRPCPPPSGPRRA